MSNVTSLTTFKKKQTKKQAAGNTLCKSGRHKWKSDKTTDFDSKKGSLVTRIVCERCGATQIKGI